MCEEAAREKALHEATESAWQLSSIAWSRPLSRGETLFPQEPAAFGFRPISEAETGKGDVGDRLDRNFSTIGHNQTVGIGRINRVLGDQALAHEIDERLPI